MEGKVLGILCVMDTHGVAAHGKLRWSEVGNDWCGAE